MRPCFSPSPSSRLDATGDVEANIERATDLASEAASGGARLVLLPEYLQFRGGDDGFLASARPIPGPYTDAFADVARTARCLDPRGQRGGDVGRGRPSYNTSALIAPDGSIAARYRKIHLFDVAVDDGPVDTESDRVAPGDEPVVADVDGVGIGLSVCYDLRFPELYRTLALAGRRGARRAVELHRAHWP